MNLILQTRFIQTLFNKRPPRAIFLARENVKHSTRSLLNEYFYSLYGARFWNFASCLYAARCKIIIITLRTGAETLQSGSAKFMLQPRAFAHNQLLYDPRLTEGRWRNAFLHTLWNPAQHQTFFMSLAYSSKKKIVPWSRSGVLKSHQLNLIIGYKLKFAIFYILYRSCCNFYCYYKIVL